MSGDLQGLRVGLSGAVPTTSELAANGWSDFDIRITVLRVVEMLLAEGATVVHGTHPTYLPIIRRAAEGVRSDGRKHVVMYLVRPYLEAGEEEQLAIEHGSYAEIRLVGPSLSEIQPGQSEEVRKAALHEMREAMIADIHALVCIGGKGFRPNVERPGVAVESGLALQQNKAVYFAAGVGGFTQAMLGEVAELPPNGLFTGQNERLKSSRDPAEIVDLVADGLRRFDRERRERELPDARSRHDALLKQGVKAWNRWRQEHPEDRPNLDAARLMRSHFIHTHLRKPTSVFAKFTQGQWEGIDLSNVSLRAAELIECDLRRANLRGANLSWANLRGADLRNADLEGVDLRQANLSWANLQGARLHGALFDETQFGRTNLRGAEGLETADHRGPSPLDHLTLELSGELPRAFLRGCGLPEEIIRTEHDLVFGPNYYSCFISYSRRDNAFVSRLEEALRGRGIRVYRDETDLRFGERVQETIDARIAELDRVVLVCSTSALESRWVTDEYEMARRKAERTGEMLLIPVMIDRSLLEKDHPLASELRTLAGADFTNWTDADAFDAALRRLLASLKKN